MSKGAGVFTCVEESKYFRILVQNRWGVAESYVILDSTACLNVNVNFNSRITVYSHA